MRERGPRLQNSSRRGRHLCLATCPSLAPRKPKNHKFAFCSRHLNTSPRLPFLLSAMSLQVTPSLRTFGMLIGDFRFLEDLRGHVRLRPPPVGLGQPQLLSRARRAERSGTAVASRSSAKRHRREGTGHGAGGRGQGADKKANAFQIRFRPVPQTL